jgi:hypothetical protein
LRNKEREENRKGESRGQEGKGNWENGIGKLHLVLSVSWR